MKNKFKSKYENLCLDVEKRLSKKRAKHCFNVADEAVKLAVKYGEDADKAYVAGLLHDIMKEYEKDKMLDYIKSGEYEIEEVEQSSPSLWHAIASAIYARSIGIDDIDILNAIRYHTVARENMTLLEKIVYLADMVSADRDYDDVDIMRKLTYENLDDAMLYALSYTFKKQSERKACIPLTTVKAYNYFITSKNR